MLTSYQAEYISRIKVYRYVSQLRLFQALKTLPIEGRRHVCLEAAMITRIYSKKYGTLMSVVSTIVFLLAPNARAQTSGATLSGTVTDQSGGVVPQATISIKNIATGIQRANTTNSAGFYVSPNLLPGNYEVKAEAQGFSTEVQTSIKLTVGEQQVLNFALRVGQTSLTVEVNTEAPAVELASSTISAVVNSTTVRELPLNGRSCIPGRDRRL